MVIDSNSTMRGKDDRGSISSKKKPDIRKGDSAPVSASAKTGSSCLRRSNRGTTSREQVPSTSLAMETPAEKVSSSIHSSTRKSEKKGTTPSAKRKLEILEREKMSSSPLRRSDRRKELTSLASSDSNNNGKVNDLPDIKKKKLRIEKSLKQLGVEAMETSEAATKIKRPNGRIKKKLNGHTYKILVSQRKRKHILPDLNEDLERPEKSPQGDGTSLKVNASDPGEDEPAGAEECTEKIEEECVERDCGGKEQSGSKGNNDNAPALRNHGELETSCLKLFSSKEALSEPLQENGVNAFRGTMIIEENTDDSGRLLVDHALVVELQIPELEQLPDSNVVEGTDLDEDLEQAEKLFQGDGTSLGVGVYVSNPVEDEADGAEKCTEKIEEECVERDCGGKDQSVSKADNDNALALRNHGELETLCFKMDNPGEALGEPSQENSVNAFSGIMKFVESTEDSKRMQVNHALVVELQTPEVGSLPDCNVVEETVLDSLPSSEFEKDNFVGTCASCCKRPSIAPTNDLLKASRTKDKVELAQCDDCSYDAINDGNLSTCAICKLDKNLLCCDGKDCIQSFHLSCLDISLDDGLPGVWHCFSCVKKKIKYGVQSVSLGIEAIWDAREVEVLDDKGLRMEKLFFVKYKGLSHIHNQWLPKNQLLLEASKLVSEFDKQLQDSKLRKEWIEPHRILKKRLLWSPKHRDDSQEDTFNCQHEWLVKWSELDYEHATWELDNASFFQSPQFQRLSREFENRHQRAKEAKLSSSPEESKRQTIVKLPKLPAGCSYGDDHNQQTVDKLLEFWSKGQNAIIIDDQKRLENLMLFIATLAFDVTQPFLIISSPSALSFWEAEFSRLAPFLNVVVYSGNRDNRKVIRTCEFYADGDHTMLQVLLSSVEAVVEDIDVILPRWEAIIIDECQDTGISIHFEQIRTLRTAVKILLFNGQLKESTDEQLNLLSLLDPPENLIPSRGLKYCELRERLSPFIAYDCRPDSSRFLEYWVPVPTSNVQLEQYCSTLLSNFTTLRSSSVKNIVGAVHDILISTKKCCDHPYLVDSALQGFLTKDLTPLDNLDVGIKASGKLQLLDTVLAEIKSRGKRVLLIYQSIRSAGILTGDILDDFLRQRFGVDSYERVDGGIVLSKKQAAIKKFNDKGSGRFVFLLEKRACSSTMKLASVDAIVIFDSDWNIMNDSRALHKLSIDSCPEPIKIFRLFTSSTLEEKVLDLATSHVTLDSNLQNISRTTSHMLLMWGASHLFSKLDVFHGSYAPNCGASLCSDISMLKEVAGELVDILTQNAENPYKGSLITKVRQTGATYNKNVPLFGQLKGQSTSKKEPHLFWNELLECKNPCWRFLPVLSQRNRKRVQYFDDLTEKPHGEPDDVTKKQKKIVNSSADAVSPRTRQREGGSEVVSPNSTDPISFSSNKVPPASEVTIPYSVEGINLVVSQKNLHGLLMPTISKLCKVLQISEDMKTMGEMLLEYIVSNHQINSESESILQAFQISLIWMAASLLKYKLNKKQSLDVAKQQLGFGCTDKEARNVYYKLRLLKNTFKQRSQKFKEFSQKDVSNGHLKKNQKKCEEHKIKLPREHEEEIQDFYRIWEEERAQIEDHTADSTTSAAQERNENAPIEFAGIVKSSDISKPSEKSNKDNNQRNGLDIPDSGLMGNCSDESCSSRHDGINTEPPFVTSHSVQILETPAQDALSPQNLAPEGECSRPSTSAQILDGVTPGCENTNPLEHAEVEHPTNAEVGGHTDDVQDYKNSNILEQTMVQPLRPTGGKVRHLDSCANEIYDVTDLIEGEPSLALPTELTGSLPHVEQPPSQNGEQSGEELLPPLCTQVVDKVLNHVAAQNGITTPADTPVVGIGTHNPPRHAQSMDLPAQPQTLHLDPLQFEFERLHKEAEEASKLHEDAKLQVNYEYEKELAEVHRKYEARLKGLEADYVPKMKEYDANKKRIYMNKIFAETFHANFLNPRPSVSSGMYQVPTTNYRQQQLLQSSQPQRTSAASGFRNIVPPASNQQNAVPSVPAPPFSSPIIACMQIRQPCTLPNTRHIGNIPIPTAANQQKTVPSAPVPPRSSPIIGSLQMSQSSTFPNIRSTGNFHVSGEKRATAPHLRTSLSTAAPSIPSPSHGLPGQDPQRRTPFSTVAHGQPQLALPPPQQPPMQPPCHMGFQNSSMSAMGLLNVESLPDVCPPNVLPRAPALGSNFVEQYLSQSGVQGGDRIGGGVNLGRLSIVTDVVCLSDDE